VKKKNIREQKQELAELCKKNSVDKLFDGEWSKAASSDPPSPQVPARVPTVTQSKLKQALSPQKKTHWGGQVADLEPSGLLFIGALSSQLPGVQRHLSSCLLDDAAGRQHKEDT
jgi:hypothetical protein